MVEKAKIFLYPKRDHVLKQLSRMGLMGKQLTNKELISEFYTIYNPEGVRKVMEEKEIKSKTMDMLEKKDDSLNPNKFASFQEELNKELESVKEKKG